MDETGSSILPNSEVPYKIVNFSKLKKKKILRNLNFLNKNSEIGKK